MRQRAVLGAEEAGRRERSLEAVKPRLFISAIYYMFSRIKQLETEYRYLLLSRIMLKPIFKHWEILKNIFLRLLLMIKLSSRLGWEERWDSDSDFRWWP